MAVMSRNQRQKRPPDGTQPAPRTASFSCWKNVLFGGVICVVCLLVLEGVLAICGVRAGFYQADPYVGFARHIPHFVPDPAAPDADTLVTAESQRRIFNLQRFAARKPDKTFRIFCLGGSTTYGHPYNDSTSFCGWLREILPRMDASRRWELINGGGISYASYREALLMEELSQYQPDLFIVLSAHNEFLEQRTYSRLIAMPEPVRGLGAILSRTRLYSAMKAGVDRVCRPATAGPATVTQMPENPAAILDRSIGPQSYHRDETQQAKIVEHYRFNLARMVEIARSVGARVIFINSASNLRDCAPFKSEHRAGLRPDELARWNLLVREARVARSAGRPAEALQRLDEAGTIDSRPAELHYQRGQVLSSLGRFADAKAAFGSARDEDVCPLRALGSLLAATADVAKERGAPLVDFVRLMEARAANGIPGEDWFLDHVHPTVEGHRQLALEIVRVMEQEGLMRVGPTWTGAVEQELRREVEGRLTARDQATALVTLAKVLYWAGKNDEAYRCARRAEPLAPEDAAVLFEVGKGAARAGNVSESVRALRKAVAINSGFVEARSLLGLQLIEAGLVSEAIENGLEAARLRPGDAQPLLNLGVMFERAGRNAEAEDCYRRAVRLSPDYAEAHNNLGWLQKMRGDYDGALESFREAVRLRRGSAMPSLGLAWMWAAHPDPGKRDVAAAVRLAEDLAGKSGYQSWLGLDTLAVTYASAGRYPEARRLAQQALERAMAARAPGATNVAARLALFQQNQPYIEPGALGGLPVTAR